MRAAHTVDISCAAGGNRRGVGQFLSESYRHTNRHVTGVGAASASVGQIRSTTCDGGWTGTGFLVSDQLILTAAHVVEGAHALTITFPDDEPRPVSVVGYRPDNDIALLRLDESVERPYLALADTAATIAQPVGVVGYPLGKSAQHVNTGIVSSVEDSAELNGHMIKRVLSRWTPPSTTATVADR